METSKILSLLKENKSQIFNSFELEGLGVFGSYAIGNQNQKSDIDLLIFPKKETIFTYKKRLGLEAFIKDLLNIDKIDIVNHRYINPIIKFKVANNILYV
ncbi:MAG: nucleotidyltransferase domain-containing protein [Chitinophagaceae bacterium]|nr:nucleotidyltransferase domain-containing protein [Chitinophagaceae bacterium]MCU0403633.1 nucleotidyltransferase domain-containing protein [Chitinophagaceae bacterium]